MNTVKSNTVKSMENAKIKLDEAKSNPMATIEQINNLEYVYAHFVTKLHHEYGNY